MKRSQNRHNAFENRSFPLLFRYAVHTGNALRMHEKARLIKKGE